MKLPMANGEFELTDDLIQAYSYKYQNLNIHKELSAMYLWLMKNPARRPILMLRFMDKWFKGAKIKPEKLHSVSSGKMTEGDIEALGRKLNLPARAGEGYQQYLRRLLAAQEKTG